MAPQKFLEFPQFPVEVAGSGRRRDEQILVLWDAMTFPQRHTGQPRSIAERFRVSLLWLKRHRRRSVCLRCGRPAGVTCHACSALVCDRCWVLSIETGAALPLCLDCAPGRRSEPRSLGGHPAQMFRSGARALLAVIAGLVLYGYWRYGWPGAWRVIATLLHPAVTLGLVPMAFLLGAFRSAAMTTARVLFRSFRSSA